MFEPKPERITEVELRDFSDTPMLPGVDGFVLVPMPRGFRERLVAEVRRLREMIEAGVVPNEGVTCPACPGRGVVSTRHHHVAGCPAEDLEAEAQAIRDERKP